MNTKKIISKISDLPVMEKAEIADAILRTLNKPDFETDRAWAKEARRRLKKFREDRTKSIPSKQVEKEIKEQLAK